MTGIRRRFDVLQRSLHWLMAALILAMLFIGVGMVSTVEPKYPSLIATHETLGTIILVLVLIRIVVRLRSGAPGLPTDLPAPIKAAAELTHYALYGFMIAMPLLGWAMQSAARYPVVLYWSQVVPTWLPQSAVAYTWLWRTHRYLAFIFFALVLMHLAAALFHGLVRRDGVFESMAPFSLGGDLKSLPRNDCRRRIGA